MNFLQRMGADVKAFQMRFGRGTASRWNIWTANYHERWRNYKVGQGLNSSVVVAPLSWMQRNFPSAPLRIRQKGAGGDLTEIDPSDSGPGMLLKLWNDPNEYYDGATMAKALLADYKTTGNAYVLKLRSDGDRWTEAWWAPSWSMKPHWPEDGTEYLDYWIYNPDGYSPQHVDPNDVIHFRDGIDPINSRLGFCAFAALVREIFTDEEASTFTAAILSNLGVPGVIISPSQVAGSLPGGRTQITDSDKVKQAFKETFGGENRGDAMVMSAPTDVKVMSWDPQQLTLRDLRKLPEERVSGVFGVPAIVASFGAGLDRSTFANYGEAREAAYEEGLIPTQEDFARFLKKFGLSEFVDDVSDFLVDFDISEVRVLQEDQNKLWDRALAALNKGGISRARFKEIVGEEPEENDLDDVYYIPVSLVVTPVQEDQTLVPVESSRVTPLTGTDVAPGDQPVAPGPVPGTNPLTLPSAQPATNGGNGNGGGTRVPVAGR